jgi:hypothetical protein
MALKLSNPEGEVSLLIRLFTRQAPCSPGLEDQDSVRIRRHPTAYLDRPRLDVSFAALLGKNCCCGLSSRLEDK